MIGSVCDAVSTNRAAVNKLMGVKRQRNTTGELLEYSINGDKIWHYFDPPHLIKSVRNNLLLKNLTHTVSFNETKFRSNGTISWNEKNKQQRTASWNDVRDFFVFNNKELESGLFNLIPKITDEHINPVRRKMKVSLATQVFSGTYGRNMYLCWKRKQFSNNCIGTAALLLFFNELFDSVNGDDVPIPDKLIGCLTATSKHFTFWEYAIQMLDTMKFSANLKSGKPNLSQVCKHWISSLKGLRRISEHLLELGFKTVALRRFNQDGLENHFFKIRNNCGSNPRPNARDFRNSYTTSIVNNRLSISTSLHANCEADNDQYMIQSLQTLFSQPSDSHTESKKSTDDSKHVNLEVKSTSKNKMEASLVSFPEDEALNCVSGKICKQLLQKMKCDACTVTVVATTTKKQKIVEHDVMRKQSSPDEIVLPKVEFINGIKTIVSEIKKKLPLLCAEKNLMQKMLSGMSCATIFCLKLSFIFYKFHKLKTLIIKKSFFLTN